MAVLLSDRVQRKCVTMEMNLRVMRVKTKGDLLWLMPKL